MQPDYYEPSEFALESAEFLVHFQRFVTKQYGVRCREHVTGCCVCDMWRLFDDAKKIICSLP